MDGDALLSCVCVFRLSEPWGHRGSNTNPARFIPFGVSPLEATLLCSAQSDVGPRHKRFFLKSDVASRVNCHWNHLSFFYFKKVWSGKAREAWLKTLETQKRTIECPQMEEQPANNSKRFESCSPPCAHSPRPSAMSALQRGRPRAA